ncbi:MAG: DUF1109 domain-containing protein [Alphaproteobacteria bacterium]|nr:DUF1109 domain-containing protein [Alphaproteobacteria bacterium]
MSDKQNNKIDALISSLSDDLSPVKKARHPLAYTLPWIIMAVILAVIAVKYVGIRYDLSDKLKDTTFLFEITVVAALAISAAITSAYLMVPDMRGKKWLIPVTFTIAGVFAIWNIIKGAIEGIYIPRINFDHCMQEGLFIAFVPMMALIFFMRSGATTKPIRMAVMNLLAGASIAYIGLRFTCSMDTVAHCLIMHLAPYMFIGALIGFGARKLYKW